MADPAQTAQILTLIKAQSAVRESLSASLQAQIAALVRAFTGWYDGPAITRLAKQLADLSRAGQRQTAASTAAYASRLLTVQLGRRPSLPGVVDVSNLRGVPLESVFGRLANDYRWAVSASGPTPGDDTAAIQKVVARARVVTDWNNSLAMREQWHAVMDATDERVAGYRRVVHPELPTEASARAGKAPPPVCGLCLVASDRVYGKSSLLPLHGNCRCTVVAIVGEVGGAGDVGSAINGDDLKRLYAAAGKDGRSSTAKADLARVRIAIHQHGELGPLLTSADDSFRGPGDIAA